MEKSYAKLKKVSEKNGVAEFQAEIPLEVISKRSDEVLVEAAQDFEIPGFRKGKVPKEIVRQNISEIRLLDSAADSALYDALNEIIRDEGLNVFGSPEVQITKISVGSPVEFKVKFIVYPNVGLPDYKKIGKEISGETKKPEIDEKEVDDAVARIMETFAEQPGNGQEKKLPELTDGFVKDVGPFSTVSQFKDEVKKQLLREKESALRGKNREKIIKEVTEKAEVSIPPLLVEQELHHLSHEREEELAKLGVSFDEYLKQLGKTKEELEKNDKNMIENQLKTDLVFREIRNKEGIRADEEEIGEETKSLQEYYPSRPVEYLRRLAESIITERKLFTILEGK
ncbi:MAG: hypothetical protein M1153_01200 [Patescibacteria group bacterium]|nr:hypothetical protein [Patescibacteria group bacterium]